MRENTICLVSVQQVDHTMKKELTKMHKYPIKKLVVGRKSRSPGVITTKSIHPNNFINMFLIGIIQYPFIQGQQY